MKLPPDIELSEDFLRLSSASTNDEGSPIKQTIEDYQYE